jgi:hypothetical protein
LYETAQAEATATANEATAAAASLCGAAPPPPATTDDASAHSPSLRGTKQSSTVYAHWIAASLRSSQ